MFYLFVDKILNYFDPEKDPFLQPYFDKIISSPKNKYQGEGLIAKDQNKDSGVDRGTYLFESELSQARSFSSHKRKTEFLLGRYLLRKNLFKTYPNQSPSNLKITLSPKGKPEFKGQKIFFNISHSNNFVAIFISDITTVGVDVESIARFKKNINGKKKWLHKNELFPERNCLQHGPENSIYSPARSHNKEPLFSGTHLTTTPETLAHIWTRKEALSKALGQGLNMDLTQVDTTNSPVQVNSQQIYLKSYVLEDSVLSLASVNHSLNHSIQFL